MQGIDVNEHDVRFVEDNWESPVKHFIFISFIEYVLSQ